MLLVARADASERDITVSTLRQLGAKRKSPRRIPWRGIPLAMEVEYQREMAAVVARMRPAFEQLTIELPRLLVDARTARGDSMRIDAGEGRRLRALVDAAYRAMMTLIRVEDVERVATKHALRGAEHNGRVLSRAAKAALGVELAITTPNLGAIIEQHVAEVVAHVLAIPEVVTTEIERMLTRALTTGRVDHAHNHPTRDIKRALVCDACDAYHVRRQDDALSNARLITNISEPTAAAIATAVERAQAAGDLAKTLAKELKDRFGFAKRRAELIARDQLSKLVGQVNAARQKAVGIRRFYWRSVSDIRVRPEHRERNGQIYAYSSPPSGELPGEPILCRCYAEPVFDDLIDDILGPTPDLAPVNPPAKGPPPPPVPPPPPPPTAKKSRKPRAPRKPAPVPAPTPAPLPVAQPAPLAPGALPPRGTPIPRPVEYTQVDPLRYRERGGWRPDDQRRIREGTDRILESFSLGKRTDDWRPMRDVLVTRADRSMGRALAFYEIHNGRITFGKTSARNLNAIIGKDPTALGSEFRSLISQPPAALTQAQLVRKLELSAQIKSQATMFHEAIHGHGIVGRTQGVGLLVEEVTTEVAARRVARDYFGLDIDHHPALGVRGGSYGDMIQEVTNDIAEQLSLAGVETTAERAYELLETASVRFKRQQMMSTAMHTPPSAAEMVDQLVERIDLSGIADAAKPGVRTKLRAAIADTARRTM